MNRLWILLLCLLVAGCGPKTRTTAEMATYCDLIVLGEVRSRDGKDVLFATEVLKGKIANDVSFRIGEEITPVFGSIRNVSGADGRVLLFYHKRFGSQCWLMTVTASGANASLVEELRKKANQAPEPTAPSGRGSS